jgi:hypothetical protein
MVTYSFSGSLASCPIEYAGDFLRFFEDAFCGSYAPGPGALEPIGRVSLLFEEIENPLLFNELF